MAARVRAVLVEQEPRARIGPREGYEQGRSLRQGVDGVLFLRLETPASRGRIGSGRRRGEERRRPGIGILWVDLLSHSRVPPFVRPML